MNLYEQAEKDLTMALVQGERPGPCGDPMVGGGAATSDYPGDPKRSKARGSPTRNVRIPNLWTNVPDQERSW